MKRFSLAVMVCAALAAGVCGAAEEEAPEARPPKGKKPSVLELTGPLDALIDEARDTYGDGDSKKAIALYREVLDKLTDIEQENLAWVKSPEFAPIRTRRVLCNTAINRIMLDEAQAHSRTMTVTDTRELEKKRADRKKAAETNPEVAKPIKLGAKRGDTEESSAPDEDGDAPGGSPDAGGDLDMVKDLIQIEHLDEADAALVKVLRADGENREARFLMALLRVQQERYTDAAVVLDSLLADDVVDEPSLLLAAGVYLSTGAYSKAIDALDQAIKTNPKRPDAYLNMAWLLLEMRPGDTADAERYYRMAVKLGAARVPDLERRLGIKQD